MRSIHWPTSRPSLGGPAPAPQAGPTYPCEAVIWQLCRGCKLIMPSEETARKRLFQEVLYVVGSDVSAVYGESSRDGHGAIDPGASAVASGDRCHFRQLGGAASGERVAVLVGRGAFGPGRLAAARFDRPGLQACPGGLRGV